MLINERHNQIIFELQINPHVTVKELAQKLNIALEKLAELQAREARVARLDTEMRRAAASLDEHQKRLPWERLMGR